MGLLALTVVVIAALWLVERIVCFLLESISRPAVVLCLWADVCLGCALLKAPSYMHIIELRSIAQYLWCGHRAKYP